MNYQDDFFQTGKIYSPFEFITYPTCFIYIKTFSSLKRNQIVGKLILHGLMCCTMQYIFKKSEKNVCSPVFEGCAD